MRAARRCSITQPTLSQQIRKLEDELGTPLFERSPRQIRLTEAGRKFLPHARASMDSLLRGTREIQNESQEDSGTIALGVIPTLCPYLIPGAVAALKKSAPKIRISLYEETTSVLVESVRSGKLDLGLLSLPIEEKGLAAKNLGSEEYLTAVSAAHPLAKASRIGRRELQKEKLLILQEGHCFSDQALDYCKIAREHDQVIFQGSSLASVMRLAEMGEGLTFVPRMAADSRMYPGLKFIPMSPPARRDIGMVWRISAPFLKTHRTLLDAIEHELQKTSGFSSKAPGR